MIEHDKSDVQVGGLIYPNKVALITNKEYENCLISSQMCIIRANPNIINPLFLKWYLESKMGKENLAVHISGTSIQKITINALRKIKIPILDLDIQNKLSNLIELWSQEKGNLEKIIYQKELLYSSLIENIIIEKEK